MIEGCESGWHALGAKVQLQAVPDGKYEFVRWLGDVEGLNCESESLVVVVDCARKVNAIFSRVWTIADGLNNPSFSCENDLEYPWVVTTSVSHDGCASVQSGRIAKNKSTTLVANVNGGGVISFWWKASCEIDPDDGSPCDCGAFFIDGVRKCEIAGETDWQHAEYRLKDGNHEIAWEYSKDKSTDAGGDCIWLDEVVWMPDVAVPTLTELANIFGEESDVVKEISDETELVTFNDFLKNCSVSSAADLSAEQKHYAYKSFKLSEITTVPQLFENEPVLKISDIELTGGNLSVTISLTAGGEEIALAKDALKQKIRRGTSLDAIDIPLKDEDIITAPSADGVSLTFTVKPLSGQQGFMRVKLE